MKNLHILIVEDEFLISQLLKLNLEDSGYKVCGPATSGEDAVKIAENENPDVVLMDIMLMGEMNGIEAAEKIAKFSDAEIIFMTGYSDKGLRDQAIEQTPYAYLNKPVNFNLILEKLENISGN